MKSFDKDFWRFTSQFLLIICVALIVIIYAGRYLVDKEQKALAPEGGGGGALEMGE